MFFINRGSTDTPRPRDSSPYCSVTFVRAVLLAERACAVTFFAMTRGGMSRTLAPFAEELRIVNEVDAASCWRRNRRGLLPAQDEW